MKLLFNKILDETGAVSPLEFSQVATQPQQPTGDLTQSINFKDLPPEGQQQLAAKAGLNIQPQPQVQPEQPVGVSSGAKPLNKGSSK